MRTLPGIVRIGLLTLLALVAVAAALSSATAQGSTRRAGVVVHFADGRNLVKCVEFAGDSITGEDLLLRTGWNVVIDASSGLGGAVCSINSAGCPVDDCFCKCRNDTQCEYWAYWHWQADGWEYSRSGGSTYNVPDGAVEGWAWGPGNAETGAEPPEFTFEQICHRSASASPEPGGSTSSSSSPGKAPEGTLEATDPVVQAGKCTVLRWVVFDAVQVTLNGAQVIAQDRMEVCPTATQRFTLMASNAVGQTTREVTIRVEGAITSTQTPTQTAQPGAATPTATQLVQQMLPLDAQSLPPTPAPTAPPVDAAPLTAPTDAPAVPAFPTAVFTPAPAAVPELPSLAVALTALPTPVLIAAAPGAGGESRPTPTAILVARAFEEAPAPDAAAPAAHFDPRLLPGYAAFLLIAAVLMGVATWVWQRRRAG